jgi:hypothetical protein
MSDPVKYGFKIGTSFNCKIEKPNENGMIIFSVHPEEPGLVVHIGTLIKTGNNFSYHFNLENLLDKMDGDYHVLLKKKETSK